MSQSESLKPCPFCGGEPERLELTDEDNFGGSVISCKKCGASSPVHFDRKENLDDSWNRRPSTADRGGVEPSDPLTIIADAFCQDMCVRIEKKMGIFPNVSGTALATTAGEAKPEWRCFHCDEVFTDRPSAAAHFGADETSEPACQIKMGAERSMLTALRRAEKDAADAWFAIHNETTEAAKAYHAQAGRHQEQLRAAEELGYERGLRDAAFVTDKG